MTDNSVEYQVVIDSGVLPGHDRGAVADVLSEFLEVDLQAALRYLDGSEHSIRDQLDLSEAAKLQSKLKDMGVDASVALAPERVQAVEAADPIPEEVPAAEAEAVQAPAAEVEPAQEPATEVEPEQEPAAQSEPETVEPETAEPETAEPEIVKPEIAAAESAEALDLDQQLAAEAEPVAQAAELDLDQEFALQEQPAAESAELDLDQEFAIQAEPAAETPELDLDQQLAPETPTLEPMEDSSDEPAFAPPRTAKPGSTMLCPSCKSLQPRAEQCESCGAVVALPTEGSGETVKLRPAARLSQVSMIAAGITAVLVAAIWVGISRVLEFEVGLFAWVIGALVGLASASTGSRGSPAGAVCAAMALAAIVGGNLLQPQTPVDALPETPPPEPEVAWSEEKARAWYEDAQRDAGYYVALDGSPPALRQFMIERDYTRARSPAEISEEEMRHFYEVDALDLAWMVENQPGFEEWSERMRGHMSGRMRATLDDTPNRSTQAPVTVKGFGAMDLVFLFLGLATAFWLGRSGLPGRA